MIHLFDIIALIVLGLCMIRAMTRGFFQELLSFGGLFGSLIAASLLSRYGAAIITSLYGWAIWNRIVAFIIIFLLAYIVFKVCDTIIQSIIERISLRNLDKAMGLLLGLGEGVVILLIVCLLINIQPFFDTDALFMRSITIRIMTPLIPHALRIIGLRFI